MTSLGFVYYEGGGDGALLLGTIRPCPPDTVNLYHYQGLARLKHVVTRERDCCSHSRSAQEDAIFLSRSVPFCALFYFHKHYATIARGKSIELQGWHHHGDIMMVMLERESEKL